jgi:hypothetical protein
MANITIKRNTGGAYENLYPRTIISQLFDTNGTTALFTGGKLKDAYLPSYIFGSMKFGGSVALSGTATTLQTIFGTWADNTEASSSIGKYYVVSTGGKLDTNFVQAVTANVYRIQDSNYSDEGQTGDPIDVEAGDWIVFIETKIDTPAAGDFTFEFAIINNTYRSATTAGSGVVLLSSDTLTSQLSGDNVITEGVLSGLLATGNLNGLTGDALLKIPTTNHTHGQYQPIDGDLTAIAALTGTSGFLKKTAADTYTLDTSTYLTAQSQDFATVTVTDTDTGHTYASTGSAVADANADTLTLVDGDGIDIDVSSTTDAIRIQHSDTSTITGVQGTAGIASLTIDGYGHITAVTTATYNNYSLPLAADGTRGGIQLGATATETNRAVILTSEKASVTLPRQIPAVTLNGASSTAPSFYAPTAAGLTGSTSQIKQRLNAVTGTEPTWIDSPNIYYDTTTGATLGDIILDVE